jgi:tryptophan halogenase
MDRRVIKKIVVVGGGSAGWFTALFAKKLMPEKQVVVIESDSIGILGAGEGTTPHVEHLLNVLDIPLQDMIKHTSCTLKNGIKFVNWNGGGDSDYFYNGFFGYNDLNHQYYGLGYLESSAPLPYACSVLYNESFAESDFASVISDLNKVPFTKSIDENGVLNFRNISRYALHVDASKLAEYLKEVGTKDRGIKRIEGIVVDYAQDDSGDVKSLTLDSGDVISCDFVFDCSGFARFFPKKFETSWKSHDDILPSDSALPFFLPMPDDDPIPTAGLAVAMDYGWMWKTPLQHRYGCGYVFDSSLTSFDDAQKEVESYLGVEIEPIKEIKYKAGYYEEPWKYNVVSVGLSSGFIEPLEASSMWVTVVFLRQIFSNVEVMFDRSPIVSEEFNKQFRKMNDQVADFIYFHHMTTREDTEFWRRFTLEKSPNKVKEILSMFEARLPNAVDFSDNYWEQDLWFRVGLAHNNETIINSVKKSNNYNPWLPKMRENYEQLKLSVKNYSSICVDHREFISDVLDNYKYTN